MKKVHILGFLPKAPCGEKFIPQIRQFNGILLRRYDNSDMIAAAILQDAVNVGCIIDVMVGKVKCFLDLAPVASTSSRTPLARPGCTPRTLFDRR